MCFIGYQTLGLIQQMWFSIIQMIRGNVSVKELSGPVGIMSEVGTSSESASSAVRDIAFTAWIAINLAVMNMLPIPALDGGRTFIL